MGPMQGLGPWDPFGGARWGPWDPFGGARRPRRPKADIMEAEGRLNGGLGTEPSGKLRFILEGVVVRNAKCPKQTPM